MQFQDLSNTATMEEDIFKPEAFRITPESFLEQRRNADRPYVFDLRSPEAFNEGHLPGAYSLPMDYFEQSIYQMPYQGDILLYGSKEGKEAEQAAELLYENGFEVFAYADDYEELLATLQESDTEIRLSDLPEEQRTPVIEEILDKKIRPALAMDGGGLSVLNIEDNKVFVEYHGACGACPSSTAGTLKFIESQLTISLNHDMEVVPS